MRLEPFSSTNKDLYYLDYYGETQKSPYIIKRLLSKVMLIPLQLDTVIIKKVAYCTIITLQICILHRISKSYNNSLKQK